MHRAKEEPIHIVDGVPGKGGYNKIWNWMGRLETNENMIMANSTRGKGQVEIPGWGLGVRNGIKKIKYNHNTRLGSPKEQYLNSVFCVEGYKLNAHLSRQEYND